MTIYALCPSTKSMKKIDSGAQLKRVYGEKGSTVFINGFGNGCKNKSGEPVRMSRILRKEGKFKLKKCDDPLVRNPLTRRCDSEEYKKRFVQRLLSQRISEIKKYGLTQTSAIIPKARRATHGLKPSPKKKTGSPRTVSVKSATYY